jgi:hypothetical protein
MDILTISLAPVQDYAPALWSFVLALYAVFAVGFPVGISAVSSAFYCPSQFYGHFFSLRPSSWE